MSQLVDSKTSQPQYVKKKYLKQFKDRQNKVVQGRIVFIIHH